MLHQMREHEYLEAFCKGAETPLRDLAKYTIALQEERRKDKLLLVYPFDVDEAILTEAAAGLKELGGDSLGVQTPHVSGEQPTLAASLDQDVKGDVTKIKGSLRAHHTVIRQDDREGLFPRELLSDAIVDFWMLW